MTLSTVAASASRPRMVSIWKLESSSTQHAGSAAPISRRSISTSSAAGLMLPAATASMPTDCASAAVSAVVVVLPVVPVMARMRVCARTPSSSSACASRLISPVSGRPRRRACAATPTRGSSPGLSATRSTPSSTSSPKLPMKISASGASAFSASTPGGTARLSATRTRAPRRAHQRAMARPDSPSPRTRTCFPVSALIAVSASTARTAPA